MTTQVTHSIARHARMLLALTFIAGGLLLLPQHITASAAGPTVVTIQFDDGNADVYQALAMLNAHGMHATFYVNTGFIGDATHLSWTQLQALFATGNDIGGHTLTHANLSSDRPRSHASLPGPRQPACERSPTDRVCLPVRVVRCWHGTGGCSLRLQQRAWGLWGERYQGLCRDHSTC